jgi:hypothetical protein
MGDITSAEHMDVSSESNGKIFSGHSFLEYGEKLKNLLAGLPVSRKGLASETYAHYYTGNLDMVFAELLHNLVVCEGILRDRAFPVKECSIQPLDQEDNNILRFNIRYVTKEAEVTRSYEVTRTAARHYIFYY